MTDAPPRETAEGFGIISQLLRESAASDRKSIALVARLSERLSHLEREVTRLRDANPEAMRPELEALRRELGGVRADVEELKRRPAHLAALDPAAQAESVKGRWAFYSLVVTSLTGLVASLVALFAK